MRIAPGRPARRLWRDGSASSAQGSLFCSMLGSAWLGQAWRGFPLGFAWGQRETIATARGPNRPPARRETPNKYRSNAPRRPPRARRTPETIPTYQSMSGLSITCRGVEAGHEHRRPWTEPPGCDFLYAAAARRIAGPARALDVRAAVRLTRSCRHRRR